MTLKKERVMKFENLQKISDEQFRRVSGVKRHTFDKMLEILRDAHAKKNLKAAGPIN